MGTTRKTRSKPIRRVLISALVFLLLCAIVNVAVAWVPMLVLSQPGQATKKPQFGVTAWGAPQFDLTDLQRRVLREEGVYLGQRVGDGWFITSLDVTTSSRIVWSKSQVMQRSRPIANGPRRPNVFPIGELGGPWGYVYEAGWPCTAFAGVCDWEHIQASQHASDAGQSHGLFDISNRLDSDNEPLRIPIGLQWRGFLINTLFYTLILYAILRCPYIVRMALRARKGRCLKCGYDLRGSSEGPCPECGDTVIPAKAGIQMMGGT